MKKPGSQPTQQLNIRLPEGLHRELKVKCALDGRSIVNAVEGLVRAYLAGNVKLPKPD